MAEKWNFGQKIDFRGVLAGVLEGSDLGSFLGSEISEILGPRKSGISRDLNFRPLPEGGVQNRLRKKKSKSRFFGENFRRGAVSRGTGAIFGQKSSLARFGKKKSLPRDLGKKKQSFGLDHGRAFFQKWPHVVVLGGPESRGTKKSLPGSGTPEKRVFFGFFRWFQGSGRIWLDFGSEAEFRV